VLRAQDLGSLGIGSPIYFRRLQAGQVIAYDLSPDGNAVDLKIFVNSPYDKFVNPGTRFWNAKRHRRRGRSGGVEVHTQSLIALLAGGLAFETPSYAGAAGGPAAADTAFTLYDDKATAMKQPDPVSQRYVLYFNESLRGLSVGAPVTLLGLPGGEVVDVGLDLEPVNGVIRGRVEIVTFPERLIARLNRQQAGAGDALAKSRQQRRALMQRLIEQRGLRAQLRSGNLLTGQLYVALDYFPDAPRQRSTGARRCRPCRWSRAPCLTSKRSSAASSRSSRNCRSNRLEPTRRRRSLPSIQRSRARPRQLSQHRHEPHSGSEKQPSTSCARLSRPPTCCSQTPTRRCLARMPRPSRSCATPCRRSSAPPGRCACWPTISIVTPKP